MVLGRKFCGYNKVEFQYRLFLSTQVFKPNSVLIICLFGYLSILTPNKVNPLFRALTLSRRWDAFQRDFKNYNRTCNFAAL